MYSVLLLIDKPDNPSPSELQSWGKIKDKISEQLSLCKDVKKLNEYSLMIPLENGLSVLSHVVVILQFEKFPYHTVIFDDEYSLVSYNS